MYFIRIEVDFPVKIGDELYSLDSTLGLNKYKVDKITITILIDQVGLGITGANITIIDYLGHKTIISKSDINLKYFLDKKEIMKKIINQM